MTHRRTYEPENRREVFETLRRQILAARLKVILDEKSATLNLMNQTCLLTTLERRQDWVRRGDPAAQRHSPRLVHDQRDNVMNGVRSPVPTHTASALFGHVLTLCKERWHDRTE